MSSYASPDPSSDHGGYYDDNQVDSYDNWNYDDDSYDKNSGVWDSTKNGGEIAGITIAAIVVPAIIVAIILAIVIAIWVELKNFEKAVNQGTNRGTTGGWLHSISRVINDIDSDAILRRMFPGGFASVLQSIEDAYTSYRGFNSPAQKNSTKTNLNKRKIKFENVFSSNK
ncbi:uncharacterized protein LOC108674471 [Hyalella azteca]|uniref:Uncharacterized protein LOC108674471 n=1 Tax=Hyalella azteca TaxID=294128 RepID=A0A8B7NVY4_HYAAZ|nr:uncharacterized protein LOC108674471 [Hyalella azteca]